MSKTIKRFTYKMLATKEGFPPTNPIVRFYLKWGSEDEKGWPSVSPDLMSEAEIDSYAELLKEDIDRVKRTAKLNFRKANARMRGGVRGTGTNDF